MERLDKIISNQTIYTRKEVKDLIKKKRITVNDEIITKSDIKINEKKDLLFIICYFNYLYIFISTPVSYFSPFFKNWTLLWTLL